MLERALYLFIGQRRLTPRFTPSMVVCEARLPLNTATRGRVGKYYRPTYCTKTLPWHTVACCATFLSLACARSSTCPYSLCVTSASSLRCLRSPCHYQLSSVCYLPSLFTLSLSAPISRYFSPCSPHPQSTSVQFRYCRIWYVLCPVNSMRLSLSIRSLINLCPRPLTPYNPPPPKVFPLMFVAGGQAPTSLTFNSIPSTKKENNVSVVRKQNVITPITITPTRFFHLSV